MSEIKFRLLTIEDVENVKEFLAKNFCGNTVVGSFMNITRKDIEWRFVKLEGDIQQGFSLGAFTEDNSLCGTVLNVAGNGKTGDKKQDLNEKAEMMFHFFKSLDCKDLDKCIGSNEYWEHQFLCVDPTYRRRGISTELLKRSHDVAKQLGCSILLARCESHYTICAFQRVGYEIMKRVYFVDYIDPVTGKKEFEGIPPPHTCIALLVRRIQ